MTKAKVVEEQVPKHPALYDLVVHFQEKFLGSSPADPEVYAKFIASRKKEALEAAGEEVETLPVDEQEYAGWSVFHRDEQGLFTFDYRLRGFFKAAAAAVTGRVVMPGFKSKIDKWVFCFPRRIYLTDAMGNHILEPHGVYERAIRIITPKGPRTTLKRSDYVDAGTMLKARVMVLPLGSSVITEKMLRSWLGYGALVGMGERRTDGFGRFTYELTTVQAGEEEQTAVVSTVVGA